MVTPLESRQLRVILPNGEHAYALVDGVVEPTVEGRRYGFTAETPVWVPGE